MAKLKHVLSDVDEVKQVGVCAVCGPVRVSPAAGTQSLACGQKWWCGRSPPERKKGGFTKEIVEERRRKGLVVGSVTVHVISDICTEDMTAECVLCSKELGRVRIYPATGTRERLGGDEFVCGRRPATRRPGGKRTHIISDVDEMKQLGTCSICGNTRVYWKPYARGGGAWLCGVTKPQATYSASKYNVSNAFKYAKCPFCFKLHRWDKPAAFVCRARIFEEFEYKCCMCDGDNGKLALCVDHNHKTGAIRGVLCHKCNFLIGHAHDSAELMARGAKYLEEEPGKALYS